jgi:hypothetical protein
VFLVVAALLALVAYVIAWRGHRLGRWAEPYHLDVVGLAALALAAVGFFWRIVWGGSWMPADGGDLASFLYPIYRFSAQSMREGILPLWNPHLYSGAPFVGDIQTGLFYPVNLLAYAVAGELTYRSMEWLSVFHLWWAGAGMYVLLRLAKWRDDGARLCRWASLAGALAFMFADSFVTHFGNLNLIAVASWLPWVFWAYLRGLGTRTLRLRWAVLSGAFLGLATLAGHAQVTVFIALALVAYSLLELVTSDQGTGQLGRGRRGIQLLGYLLVCCVVAVLLAAVVLLPGMELARHTTRAEWDYQQTVGYSLSPAQWIGLLIPGFFGRGPQFHWGLWPRVEVGYLGVLPLILALLAVLRGRPRRMWAMLGLAVSAFLIALGIYSLPHGWLTTLVPLFGQFRAPARLVLVMTFGLAVLASIGLDALLRAAEDDRASLRRVFRLTAWAAVATCCVGLPLSYFALITGQDKSPEVFTRISVATIAVAIFAAMLLASMALIAARRYGWARPQVLGLLAVIVIFLDLASTGAYNDLGTRDPTLTYEHPGIVSFLRGDGDRYRIDARTGIDQLWQPSTALVHGLDDVWGVVNPMLLAGYERYWEGMGSRSTRLYDFLNAKYIIARRDVELDWEKFEPAFDGDPQLNVYRNREALPRAFLVHQAIAVPDREAAWDAIQSADFDPARMVVVEGEAAPLGPAIGPERADIVEYGANEIVVEVETTAPGYLVLSEVFYPDWRALDEGGERRQVLRANYAFRAVHVDPGAVRLRIGYFPKSFSIGVAISCATVLGFLVGAVWLWRKTIVGRGADGNAVRANAEAS